MARIAILYGGRSGEHEVSRNSAAAVLSNLSHTHQPILIGINREGVWHLQDIPDPIPGVLDMMEEEARRLGVIPGLGVAGPEGELLEIDAVLPILHGSFGEDGSVQGLLESARVPYAGAGILGSALAMDKDLAKQLWTRAGLPVAPWRTLTQDDDDSNPGILWNDLKERLGIPLFVKPANGGSSLGVSRVADESAFSGALKTAWRHDRKVLVEQAVTGREIECSVMGYGSPEAFPPGEVVPKGSHEFYDYDAKYVDPDGALLKVPADLSEPLSAEVKELALRACAAVEAGGLSRVDFLLDTDSECLYINELNTIPGMTSISLFPRMTAAGGVDFTAMLERLIEGAVAEHSYREGLSYERE